MEYDTMNLHSVYTVQLAFSALTPWNGWVSKRQCILEYFLDITVVFCRRLRDKKWCKF